MTRNPSDPLNDPFLNSPEISPETLLGAYELDPAVAARYAELRRSHATNIINILAAEDEHYQERQGETNTEFITAVNKILPSAELSASVSYREAGLSDMTKRDIYTLGFLGELSCKLEVDRYLDREQRNESSLAELAGLRAAVIWVDQEPDEVFSVHSSRYVSTRLDSKPLSIPYVIAGHKLVEEGAYTELLLLPLLTEKSEAHYPGAYRAPAGGVSTNGFSKQFSIRPSDSLGGVAAVNLKEPNLTALMTTNQYQLLIAMQETLIEGGIEKEEVKRAHDKTRQVYKLARGIMPVIRAECGAGWTLSLKVPPKDPAELDSEEFDIHLTGSLGKIVHPVEFASFHVLGDLQRTSAMLGRSQQFDPIVSRFLERSQDDPAYRLLHDK